MGNRRTHENLHRNIRPFKCDLCEKVFAQRSTMQVYDNVFDACQLLDSVFFTESSKQPLGSSSIRLQCGKLLQDFCTCKIDRVRVMCRIITNSIFFYSQKYGLNQHLRNVHGDGAKPPQVRQPVQSAGGNNENRICTKSAMDKVVPFKQVDNDDDFQWSQPTPYLFVFQTRDIMS